jgi:hypothetical protein
MYATSARRVSTSRIDASSKDGTAGARPSATIGSRELRKLLLGKVDGASGDRQVVGGVS